MLPSTYKYFAKLKMPFQPSRNLPPYPPYVIIYLFSGYSCEVKLI